MFAKDAPLASQVNDVITDAEEGRLPRQLHETWFGAKPDAGRPPRPVADMPKASRALATGLGDRPAAVSLRHCEWPMSIFDTFFNFRVLARRCR